MLTAFIKSFKYESLYTLAIKTNEQLQKRATQSLYNHLFCMKNIYFEMKGKAAITRVLVT